MPPAQHTHIHTPCWDEGRGETGETEKTGWKIEDGGDGGGGGDRPTVCQLVSCPRVVTHTLPSVSPSTHTKTPLRLSWASHPSHMCLLACTRLVRTHTRSYTCTHTHAGVTVRQMSGGSSQCNSPPWPNTDSSRHLRQLPLSQWKEPIWIWCQKKQSTVAELWKRLLNWGFIYSNAFSLLDWIES